MSLYMGIDQGRYGAICVLDHDKIDLIEMPLLSDGKTISAKRIKDFLLVYKNRNEKIFCVIEEEHPRPGNGIKASFTFGRCCGKVEGVLELFSNISVQAVPPNVWKKHYSLNSDKLNSILMAESLFPQLLGKFRTQRGKLLDGKAEATLLAEYARRIYKE